MGRGRGKKKKSINAQCIRAYVYTSHTSLSSPPPLGRCRYQPEIDGTVRNEFSTACLRVGHTMLTSNLSIFYCEEGQPKSTLMREVFFNPAFILEVGIGSVLKGLATKVMQEIDNFVVRLQSAGIEALVYLSIHPSVDRPTALEARVRVREREQIDDVRNFLFGEPGDGALDLVSLNLQRARDHGIIHFNGLREALGLAALTSFSEITANEDIAQTLETLYETIDNVDPWVGNLCEVGRQ